MTRNLFLVFALLTSSSSAWAQLVGSTELYGEGVHRFFARDYQGADELLSRAIESGSQDPRAYYFRGLARETFGGGGEVDFEEGARLEASGRSGPMIGYSLSRVQGVARIKLEKARRDARVLAAQQRALMQKSAPAPIATPPADIPQPSPTETDPFKDGQGTRSDETKPADPPAQPEVGDPFGDEPKPAAPTTPPDADPFGGTTPAADPAGDDPFK